MKRNDVGDFIILYVEPGDQRADLFQTVGMQKKPVVIILAGPAGILQKPDDFALFKYVKRQADLQIIFIFPHGSQQAQLAARNGFPVYPSMDALLDALNVGPTPSMGITRSSGPSRSLDASNTIRKNQNRDMRKGINSSPTPYIPRTTKDLEQAQALQISDSGKDSREALQGSRRISQPLTPIPESLTPEEDAELQRPYSDSYRTLSSDTKGNMPYNTGNDWSGSSYRHIADRNTGPLPPRNVESEQEVVGSEQEAKGEIGLEPTRPLRPFSIHFPGKGKPHLYILLCLLIIMGTGSLLVLPHLLNAVASTAQINGHLVFTSSGQVSETSNQGIEDQVTLDLTNLAIPATGKALYAWLLGDKRANDPETTLLGKLQVNNGTAHLFYPGNAAHSNMLLTMSRVLVTEEDIAFTPIAPSPDQSTWRYSSEFSSTPINAADNTQKFSFLDHLRHLLAADPTLDELELPGGLNNWLYNNTSKVKEWVDSTRQQWEETKDTNFVRRQLERALQFLDGDTFVYRDIPQGTSLLVNERLARVGLINITGPNQEPPDYLDHISHHLNGLLEAKPSPAAQQKITALTTALGNVNQWLKQVRQDARLLLNMTDDQMMQQSTLSVINDMITNMDNAYSGRADPSTNTVHEGVDWIHNQMQFLATLDITPIAQNGISTNKVAG